MSWDEGLIQSLKEVAYPPELYHYTNISESTSALDVWTKDDGIVDLMIEYELRKGLNLFQSTLSAST